MGEELKNSIKAKLYDFAYTPFMSSYVISWILFNHKYLLVYFGTSTLDDKLFYLGECHVELLFPLYVALIYVFIYPAIALVFYYATLWYNKQTMTIKQHIEDETPITQEKARELKREHYKLADERDQALDKLKKSQKEHAEVLDNTLKPLQDQIESYHSTQKVSDELIQKLEAEKEKMIRQHDAAIDIYNTTINGLEQQIANFKRPAYVVDEEEVVAKSPTVSVPNERIIISNGEDDRTKILRYFYEGNYKAVSEEVALDRIVGYTKLPRPKVKVIFNGLVKEGLLKTDRYEQYQLTDTGNHTLLALFDKTVQPEEQI